MMKIIKFRSVMAVAYGLIASAGTAAFGSSILGGYNLGVTYEASASHAEISYDTTAKPDKPDDCIDSSARPGFFRCTAYLGPDENSSTPSFSVFLEKPFKRQGFFFFDGGLTFSTIAYKGGIISKPSSPGAGNRVGFGSGGSTDTIPGTQPLTMAYLEFYGINWQGYVRFGITPHYLPDILISLGGGVQTAGGTVKLFKEKYTRYVVQPEVFGVVEAVLLRVGTGSMSVYLSQDQSFVSQIGTTLVDDNPSGNDLSNIRLGLLSSASGIRLLFPF